uniref:Uncharacterized protein n=1 Tax=Romanomermis culicivorax TaxID=13658 RepID=A0A915JH59_ROMCU
QIEEECQPYDNNGYASPLNCNSQATILVDSQSQNSEALNIKREEINITWATIIIDSQITSCNEIENELPNSDEIPEMQPKPIPSFVSYRSSHFTCVLLRPGTATFCQLSFISLHMHPSSTGDCDK